MPSLMLFSMGSAPFGIRRGFHRIARRRVSKEENARALTAAPMPALGASRSLVCWGHSNRCPAGRQVTACSHRCCFGEGQRSDRRQSLTPAVGRQLPAASPGCARVNRGPRGSGRHSLAPTPCLHRVKTYLCAARRRPFVFTQSGGRDAVCVFTQSWRKPSTVQGLLTVPGGEVSRRGQERTHTVAVCGKRQQPLPCSWHLRSANARTCDTPGLAGYLDNQDRQYYITLR